MSGMAVAKSEIIQSRVDGLVKIYANDKEKSAYFVFTTAEKVHEAAPNRIHYTADLLRSDCCPKDVPNPKLVLGVTAKVMGTIGKPLEKINEVIYTALLYLKQNGNEIEVPVIHIESNQLK